MIAGDARADTAARRQAIHFWTMRHADVVSLQNATHSNLMFDSLYPKKYNVINKPIDRFNSTAGTPARHFLRDTLWRVSQ
jgi:hypothetical protein